MVVQLRTARWQELIRSAAKKYSNVTSLVWKRVQQFRHGIKPYAKYWLNIKPINQYGGYQPITSCNLQPLVA